MELKVAIFFGLPEQGEPCTVVQTLHSYILSLSRSGGRRRASLFSMQLLCKPIKQIQLNGMLLMKAFFQGPCGRRVLGRLDHSL
ncbi:hypothetical protein QYF36_022922 [Acer negundo]|nr:hypothetical protein QYF36_022922 [Acer negundo]